MNEAMGDGLVEQLASLLAEALAPRLAPLLDRYAEQNAATNHRAPTALITLDELVAELPAGKQPQTWKRWLYERSRRNQIPGCRKLGGRLFFNRAQTLAWLEGPNTGSQPGGTNRTG